MAERLARSVLAAAHPHECAPRAGSGRLGTGAVKMREMVESPPTRGGAVPLAGRLGWWAGLLPRLMVPAAALAAIAALSTHDADPAAGAEGLYLGLLAAAVLAAAAALAPPPGAEVAWGAVFTAAACWALPPLPGRGAAVLPLLAATVATAAARRLRTHVSDGLPESELPLAFALPLAFGVQLLLRGELVFPATLRIHPLRGAVALVALPIAAAVATVALSRSLDRPRALLAATAAALLGPGWNVATTLALAALGAAALSTAAEKRQARGLPPLALLGRRTTPPWVLRSGAFLVLLVPIAWEPRSGFIAAACAAAVLWRRRAVIIALAVAIVVAALPLIPASASFWAAAASAAPSGHLGAVDPLRSLPWLLLLVPAVVFPERPAWAGAAVLLALATPWIPDRATLAAPCALAALALPARGTAATLQRLWSSALLGGAAILASYPWLRPDPLAATITLLSGPPAWSVALTIVGGVLLFTAADFVLTTPPRRRLVATAIPVAAAAAIVIHLSLALPAPREALLSEVVPLTRSHPRLQMALGDRPVRLVVVDSALTNSAGLAKGAPVAAVILHTQGRGDLIWRLRAGEDTGEWAARRPDVARSAGLAAPAPWSSWVDQGFFGQRYRAQWGLAPGVRAGQLTIARSPTLPADLELAVYQLELGR
jgi:hypothetical protein